MPSGLATLRMNPWRGDVPLPGEYLRTRRGRTAYRVVGVRRGRDPEVVTFVCEREPVGELLAGSVIHRFWWHPRGPKGKRV